jgi:hypothetical protein
MDIAQKCHLSTLSRKLLRNFLLRYVRKTVTFQLFSPCFGNFFPQTQRRNLEKWIFLVNFYYGNWSNSSGRMTTIMMIWNYFTVAVDTQFWASGWKECFHDAATLVSWLDIFSRERSSTGSNDCFVIVVLVGIFILWSFKSLKVSLCRAMAHFVPSSGT